MYYTSEGRAIQRFDVGTNTQMTNFATLGGGGNAFALRLLADGGLLVADNGNVKRLDSTGAQIQTYDIAGVDGWFALNLDPNATSFWSGSFSNGNLYKFDIATGALLQTIATGSGSLFGVSVFGEITQGGPPTTVPEPGTLALLGVGLLGVASRRKLRQAMTSNSI
jgi:hypothetical protein